MYYDTMPLYPPMGPGCERDSCVRVPVFGGDRWGTGRMPDACQCRRVTIENPRRPGERAEVLLGVDDCGNLVVCVRRDGPPPCEPRPDCRPPRPDCRPRPDCHPDCRPPRGGCRGRLYGSWR